MPIDYKSLRELVAKSGKTQSQIAAATGIARPNISRFLAGKIENPSIQTIERIAEALQVPVFTLLTAIQK